MATIDFPNSPSVNQTYTYNNRTWLWNGNAWVLAVNNVALQQGLHTALVPVQAMADDLSGSLTAPGSLLTIYNSTYGVLGYYRQFSGTANNFVGVPFNLPKGARGGAIKFRIVGFSPSADASAQTWTLNSYNVANGTNVYTTTGQTTQSINVSFTTTTANAYYVSAFSGTFTITTDADGVQPFFTLYRQGATDTSNVAFNLVACEIQYTINQPTDA